MIQKLIGLSVLYCKYCVLLWVSLAVAYPVVRNRGRFGEVSVSWVLEPHMSADVSPVQGYIVFAEGEYMKNLTLFSVPDEVKPSLKRYSI